MIKLKAILRILFHKRFLVLTDSGKSWWLTQQNMRISDLQHIAQWTSDIAKEELDSNMAVYEAEQILKREQ
jgi:hypothetical protein